MSIEVESNPFRPDGELSKEAEIIIKNSTILRDKVIISRSHVTFLTLYITCYELMKNL